MNKRLHYNWVAESGDFVYVGSSAKRYPRAPSSWYILAAKDMLQALEAAGPSGLSQDVLYKKFSRSVGWDHLFNVVLGHFAVSEDSIVEGIPTFRLAALKQGDSWASPGGALLSDDLYVGGISWKKSRQ